MLDHLTFVITTPAFYAAFFFFKHKTIITTTIIDTNTIHPTAIPAIAPSDNRGQT